MKCPHCLSHFSADPVNHDMGPDPDGHWFVARTICDNDDCRRVILHLVRSDPTAGGIDPSTLQLMRPRGSARPISPEVPDPYRTDFSEAAITLPDSAKASAALSRRCLQSLIRDQAGITYPSLSKEIDELLASGKLPSWLGENVDAVRNVGNFAAHPQKDTNTGAIVDVEPVEAEWLLDVLEGLFDFYFVQPEIGRRKREALNEKLKAAGKPEMK
jgi:hypothetical protein